MEEPGVLDRLHTGVVDENEVILFYHQYCQSIKYAIRKDNTVVIFQSLDTLHMVEEPGLLC